MFDAQKFLSTHRNNAPRETIVVRDEEIPCQGLSQLQFEQWGDYKAVKANRDYATVKLLQLGVVDENGKPQFSDSQLTQLIELPAAIVEPIARKILELSGVGAEVEKALVKNSEPIPTGDSESDSDPGAGNES